MYVCHCEAVTDRDVRAAIVEGATTPVDVAARTGTSLNCGICLDTVNELLVEGGHASHADLCVEDVVAGVDALLARAREALECAGRLPRRAAAA